MGSTGRGVGGYNLNSFNQFFTEKSDYANLSLNRCVGESCFMFQIRKLSEIKNYRAYKDFKWDESVLLFGKNNLFFGWNASGKSSLADLLLSLTSANNIDEDAKFRILFQDENNQRLDVSDDHKHSDKYIIRVYDQQYIERNIEKTDALNHIYSIGEGQISKSRELKSIQSRIDTLQQSVRKAFILADKAQKKYDAYLTKSASYLKNEFNLPNNYNKNNLLHDYEASTEFTKLSPDRYSNIYATVYSSVLPELELYNKQQVDASIETFISSLLSAQPIIRAIDKLRDNPDIASWVALGLSLHKDHPTKKCLYCDNVVAEERLSALEAHFNKEFQALSEKIKKAIERLATIREEYTRLQLTFLKANQYYPELQDKFHLSQEQFSEDCLACINVIDQITKLLIEKSQDLSSIETVQKFNDLNGLHSLTKNITQEINTIIIQNNEITSRHSEVVRDAQKQLKSHWFADNSDEITALIKSKKESAEEHIDLTKTLESTVKERTDIVNASSNVGLPAVIMNEELALFLGRDEIQFLNQENGYVLSRNGKVARNLSKGEKNAISLVYFLNSLNDINIDKKDTIVVLDDPISSFDSNYYYYALAYIRNKMLDVGQSLIFTHKFSFYKDLCLVFKDEKSRHYLVERDKKGIYIRYETKFVCNYFDEYSYLFNRVIKYAVSSSPDSDESLAIANLARKILESFLTFKVPNDIDLIEKVRALSAELTTPTRAMCRLLNSKSHLQIIPDQDQGDDIELISSMQQIIRDMLSFIFQNDPMHFRILVDKCDSVPVGFIGEGSLHFN